MPYFKDKTGGLHFLDNASFAHLLPSDSVEITDEEAEALRPIPEIIPVVSVVTPRQFKLALLAADLLDNIEAAIAESSDRALKINWEYATEFRRDNPFVTQMAQAINKTDTEVDALFVLAESM